MFYVLVSKKAVKLTKTFKSEMFTLKVFQWARFDLLVVWVWVPCHMFASPYVNTGEVCLFEVAESRFYPHWQYLQYLFTVT